MDKRQAASIQKHSLEILKAIARIEIILRDCTKEEITHFIGPIGDIVIATRFSILQGVYAQFPELRVNDKEEEPSVSSDMKWSDVTLPASITVADLDAIILSTLMRNWLKTARIINDAAAICKDRFVPLDFEVIGARIQVLADQRQLEAQGNLSMWRHSEVRLPPSS